MNHNHPTPGRWRRVAGLIAALGLVSLAIAAVPDRAAPEAQYAAAMHRIMAQMNTGMRMAPQDPVDRQFITLMIPHHQAAIDMARLQLRYGHDVRLARLAQEIIVEQQQEITVMQTVLATAP